MLDWLPMLQLSYGLESVRTISPVDFVSDSTPGFVESVVRTLAILVTSRSAAIAERNSIGENHLVVPLYLLSTRFLAAN